MSSNTARNLTTSEPESESPCPCGSGKEYRYCHGEAPLRLLARPVAGSPTAIEWVELEAEQASDSPHLIALRPSLSRLPGPGWESLWSCIEQRLRDDEELYLPGLRPQAVTDAFERLRGIFTADWIKAVFQRDLGTAGKVSPASPFSHEASEQWFPAYHLSRLATGVICRDPALHTLADLGLALRDLDDFAEREALQLALARRPALHHQAALAADLHGRGYPMSLQGDDGDLRIILDDQPYLLRTVEVSLGNITGDIQANLRADTGDTPLILHALVSDASWYRPEQGLPQELERLELPAGMLAVVVGRRFLDAGGGRLKRNAQKVIYNNKSPHGVDNGVLEKLFAPNYQRIEEPCLNVGTYHYLK